MEKKFSKQLFILCAAIFLIASSFTICAPAYAQPTYMDRFLGSIVAPIGKQPVDAATTSNITLSGYQTVDGLSLSADNLRVLVKNQTDSTQNGIYVVYSSAWQRASDFNGPSGTVSGQLVYVTGGNSNVGLWQLTTANPVQIDKSGGQTTPASSIVFLPANIPITNFALNNANIYVGNVANLAVGVPLSGDCSMANTGAITCTKTNGSNFATIAHTGVITDATGTLTVANGGTGNSSLTSGSLLVGNGSSAVNYIAPSTNTCLITTGGAWAAGSCTGASGTGTVNPGTSGQISYYASSSNVVSGNASATISNGALTLGQAASVQGSLILSGSSSGTTAITAPTSSGGTMALQAGSDTLTGRATTDTLTNKTYDTAGTGNTFKINGQGITAISGNTGKVATTTGTLTSGHLASIDASGNFIDGGAPPSAGIAPFAITGFLPSSITGSSTTASLTISAGIASDTTNSAYITKGSTTSWAVSNGNAINGYSGGTTLASSTTIHMYMCSGASGIGSYAIPHASFPLAAASCPTGYTANARHVFEFTTASSTTGPIAYTASETGGGAMRAMLSAQVTGVNDSSVGTVKKTETISGLPLDIALHPIGYINNAAGSVAVILYSPDEVDVAPSTITTMDIDGVVGGTQGVRISGDIISNTSAQVEARAASGLQTILLFLNGWVDYRRY